MTIFLNAYLTEYDDSLSGDSYIDPIGTLIVWSALGRQVFDDRVNSVSNDVRNYTLNPWVIHVRAAHFINNTEPERYMLFSVISMLNTAKENRLKRIAMPAIGTGAFKFPPMLAARITAKALVDYARTHDEIELVRICVASEEMRQLYQSAVDLMEHASQSADYQCLLPAR